MLNNDVFFLQTSSNHGVGGFFARKFYSLSCFLVDSIRCEAAL